MKPNPRILVEQQPDTSWKAWVVGDNVVINSETKEKAVSIAKMFRGGGEKEQSKDHFIKLQRISL